MADGTHEEFTEDCTHAVQDLTSKHPNDTIASHAYDFSHIDQISSRLGIPWELSKDAPFSSTPVFIGFIWNLESNTVSLTTTKRTKYINTIHESLCTTVHTLEQVQKLHGRLSHASLVIPEGSMYLTSLQLMLGIFGSNPFMPRGRPCGTVDELRWWLRTCTELQTPHPHPTPSTRNRSPSLLRCQHQLRPGNHHWQQVAHVEASQALQTKWMRYRVGRKCCVQTTSSHIAHIRPIQHATHGLL